MNIEATSSRYMRSTLAIVGGMLLVGGALIVAEVLTWDVVAVAVMFNLLCSVAYVKAWKAVAKAAPESLPRLYLASSAFRLMAAVIVVLVYCVAVREAVAIRTFAITFILCYLVMLCFDAMFFAKVSKKSNQ